MINKKLFSLLFVFIPLFAGAQSYLHVDGKNIVTGAGENFLIRGIGTGNWMIMEGYMMKTDGVFGTQHEIRAKLVETIGKSNTDTFFETWLDNQMTRTDIDSIKAWGFNSIRVALHYLWFTPPIEDEPVQGEITWIEAGFIRIDSLLDRCGDNEMYLILDMHGTPGGQGKNADISDYDPSKPSLWESELNQRKLVALWRKLAERYSNEPWIGGYDLINETNWDFENSGNENGVNCKLNIPLIEMHERIIDAIRTVDSNHIVFVSGNSWGNNYSGMNSLASYDDNLSYTFHKYWNFNDVGSIQGFLDMRESLNVPFWMSESGENSNTWFTNAISLFESNNIGWSWWPVKKASINNVEEVVVPGSYDTLIKVWKNELNVTLTSDEIFQAVMDWAESQKIENCRINYDVIDAMIRQTKTTAVVPFVKNTLGNNIYFTDYDLGRNKYAYYDVDTCNYSSAGQDYISWNQGWSYRNDGVDIESCSDEVESTNGYNVGWTSEGEWLQYSIKADSVAAYTLTVRSASGGSGSKFHFEANGVRISNVLRLPGTSGWQAWETTTFEDIIIPGGDVKLKFVTDQSGSNLSFFNFSNPKPLNAIDFRYLSAKTSEDGTSIIIDLNKEITGLESEIQLSDFELLVDGNAIELSGVSISPESNYVIVLTLADDIYSDNELSISYNGTSVQSGTQDLIAFSDVSVNNEISIVQQLIPGKIQAEDFYINNGFSIETCDEGGYNTGYADAGDYLEYKVHCIAAGDYTIAYRVAATATNAQVIFQIGDGESFISLDTTRFTSTTGWQKWETQKSDPIYLEKGYYSARILVKQGEHNLNWFEIKATSIINGLNEFQDNYMLYPNPAEYYAILKVRNKDLQYRSITVYNINGRVMNSIEGYNSEYRLNTTGYPKGMYFIQVNDISNVYSQKLTIQ